MAVATVVRQYARGDKWAFEASWDPGGGGAGNTIVTVNASDLPQIRAVSEELCIDGISVLYVSVAAGRTIMPQAYVIPAAGGDELLIALTQYDTTEIADFHHIAPLNIPVLATSGGVIVQIATDAAANGDLCYIAAWGTFSRRQDVLPVDVKSVQFFKDRPRTGEA